MNENKSSFISGLYPYIQNIRSDNSKNSSDFQYKPPNNTGILLAIIGGGLTLLGDVLAIIGTIVQLNIDNHADFQAQLEAFKSDKEKEKMREEIDNLIEQIKEIDDLKEQIKQLEEKIKKKPD